jgi:ketosteroid isomerase-like protein
MSSPGDPGAAPSPLLVAFRSSYEAGREPFNRHDFRAAFASAPEDVHWTPLAAIPGARDLRGRAAVIRFFEELLDEFPDWRSTTESFSEPLPGVVLVEFSARATGAASGAPTTNRVFQVWDLRARPVRVIEFGSEAEAIESLGATGA